MENQVASTDVSRWLYKNVNIKKGIDANREIIGCKLDVGVNVDGKW